MLELETIDKEYFFRNWSKEALESLPEEEKERVIKWFVNRNKCLLRDNFMCQNSACKNGVNKESLDERKEIVNVHHIVPKRDFKENPTLSKRFGYECDDLDNLTTLCKKCHVDYERAAIEIIINGQPYKLERPSNMDFKKIILEGKKVRHNLKKLGQVGWYGLSEEERTNLIILLMRWITMEWTEIAETMDDDDYEG